jgi:hypothetical protein
MAHSGPPGRRIHRTEIDTGGGPLEALQSTGVRRRGRACSSRVQRAGASRSARQRDAHRGGLALTRQAEHEFPPSTRVPTRRDDVSLDRAFETDRYLVLEASQEKADAFFGGHRFWQIPGTSMHDDSEATVDMLRRGMSEYGLEASALWAVEYVSTIFTGASMRSRSSRRSRPRSPAYRSRSRPCPVVRHWLQHSESSTARTSGQMHNESKSS